MNVLKITAVLTILVVTMACGIKNNKNATNIKSGALR